MSFWFNIIRQWKNTGKGEYGITFPFLIGAISIAKDIEANEKLVRDIFCEMEKRPINGYYSEVRWCENINEPVVCMKPLQDLAVVAIKGILRSSEQESFGFTADLMSMFNLDCKTPEECREKLIMLTIHAANTGNYSKNNGLFTPFTEGDKAFIEYVRGLSDA